MVARKNIPQGTHIWGPLSNRERFVRNVAYRFNPPRHPHLNAPQQVIWRVQRLVLGNNTARSARREMRRRRSTPLT